MTLSRPTRRTGRQHTISAVGLLIDRHVVWQSPQQVQLAFNPPENLFGWSQKSDVAKTPWQKSALAAREISNVHR